MRFVYTFVYYMKRLHCHKPGHCKSRICWKNPYWKLTRNSAVLLWHTGYVMQCFPHAGLTRVYNITSDLPHSSALLPLLWIGQINTNQTHSGTLCKKKSIKNVICNAHLNSHHHLQRTVQCTGKGAHWRKRACLLKRIGRWCTPALQRRGNVLAEDTHWSSEEVGMAPWNTSAEDAHQSPERCWKDRDIGVMKWIPLLVVWNFCAFHMTFLFFIDAVYTNLDACVFWVISRYRNMDGLRYTQALTFRCKSQALPCP